tara:strand:- start:17 stop:286 length:270 start_codon:yes stop_codon:yes gene_type:complete
MKHLNNLIKGTIADSKAPWAISEDMSDMYKQDAKDFKDVLKMIKDKNFSGAKKLIQFMDTLPREGVLIAIARDLGNDWVEENLEYEVRI